MLYNNQGIHLIRDNDSRAIEIDSSNQVFYCNRAAAFTKLNNHYAAIEDCKRAIDMDPKYGLIKVIFNVMHALSVPIQNSFNFGKLGFTFENSSFLVSGVRIIWEYFFI